MGKKEITTTLESFLLAGPSMKILFSSKGKSIKPQIKVRIGLCAIGTMKKLEESQNVYNESFVEIHKEHDENFELGGSTSHFKPEQVKDINEKIKAIGQEEISFFFNPVSSDDLSRIEELSVLDIGHLAECGIIDDSANDAAKLKAIK
jgi:hypothetical protein